MASLWYSNVGHARSEVVDAVTRQMREFETYHCFERFAGPRAEELAARLSALAPVPGSRVFLTSGGSEAVDTAIKRCSPSRSSGQVACGRRRTATWRGCGRCATRPARTWCSTR